MPAIRPYIGGSCSLQVVGSASFCVPLIPSTLAGFTRLISQCWCDHSFCSAHDNSCKASLYIITCTCAMIEAHMHAPSSMYASSVEGGKAHDVMSYLSWHRIALTSIPEQDLEELGECEQACCKQRQPTNCYLSMLCLPYMLMC